MGKIGGLALGMTLSPIAVGSLGYAATRVNWPLLANNFFTGPGRISRILMLIFAIFNWKNMPFVWTVCRFLPLPLSFCTQPLRQAVDEQDNRQNRVMTFMY